MTAPARIKQDDLNRVTRSARAAGFSAVRVRIDPDGTIDILFSDAPPDSPPGNPLDRLLDDAA